MSLEDELKRLKDSIEKEKAEKLSQDKLNRLEEIDKNRQLSERARKISSEKIEPFFSGINQVFADGKGQIDLPYFDKNNNVLSLTTSLTWNKKSEPDNKSYDQIHARINLEFGTVEFNGCRTVKIDDDKYIQVVGNILKEILKNPENYHHEEYHDLNW